MLHFCQCPRCYKCTSISVFIVKPYVFLARDRCGLFHTISDLNILLPPSFLSQKICVISMDCWKNCFHKIVSHNRNLSYKHETIRILLFTLPSKYKSRRNEKKWVVCQIPHHQPIGSKACGLVLHLTLNQYLPWLAIWAPKSHQYKQASSCSYYST